MAFDIFWKRTHFWRIEMSGGSKWPNTKSCYIPINKRALDIQTAAFVVKKQKRGGCRKAPLAMLLCPAGSPIFLEGIVETLLFDAKSMAELSKAAAICWPQVLRFMKQGERGCITSPKKHSLSEIILPNYVHFFIIGGQIIIFHQPSP